MSFGFSFDHLDVFSLLIAELNLVVGKERIFFFFFFLPALNLHRTQREFQYFDFVSASSRQHQKSFHSHPWGAVEGLQGRNYPLPLLQTPYSRHGAEIHCSCWRCARNNNFPPAVVNLIVFQVVRALAMSRLRCARLPRRPTCQSGRVCGSGRRTSTRRHGIHQAHTNEFL